jgi:glycosyltransferase 2 family protein
MNSRSRQIIITTLKILFSGGLIAWLLMTRVNIKEVLVEFAGIQYRWLAFAAMLHLAGLLFSSCRWKVLLKAQGIHQPIIRLFSYYIVGHFFNMFLPTRVGGDLVRIYDTSRDHGSAIQPTAVILVERITGMLTMLMIAAVVLLMKIDIGFDYMARIPGVYTGIIVFFLLLITGPFVLHPRLESLVIGILQRFNVPNKIRQKLKCVYTAFRIYAKTPGALAHALFWGILLQMNYILHYWFLAKALGLEISVAFFLVIIPIRAVTLMFPLTINAIGLREWFDVATFGFLGIAEASAVAFAELGWLLQIFLALFGGIYYAFRKKRQPQTPTAHRQNNGS